MSPVEFLYQEVLGALFVRLDQAFPEFGWQRTARGWVATNREYTKLLLGARPNRVVCNQPGGFYVFGGQPTSWTAYVSGGRPPRGRDFIEAVRKLATLAGVSTAPLEHEASPEEQEAAQVQERRAELLEAFLAYTRACLEAGTGEATRARTYLAERGFSPEDLESLEFGLYTTPADVRAHLLDGGFAEEELTAAGMLGDARWAGRLVAPWRDRWGRIGTFYARDLSGAEDEGAKYLYLRGTAKTELIAFGLDVALRSAEKHEPLVLVEGLLDVSALQARGFDRIAAIGGGGGEFTPTRWEALADLGVRAVILVLDNDEAGQRGTLAAIENAARAARKPVVYVVDPKQLGAAKDPDELVRRQGLDALRRVLEQRSPAHVFRALALLEDVTPESPTEQRRDAVERIVGFAASLQGESAALDLADVLSLAAERTGYAMDLLSDRVDHLRQDTARQVLESVLKTAASELAASPVKPPREVAQRLRARLDGLLETTQDSPPPFSVARLDRESAALPQGKPSGWNALDDFDVRFNPGELALIAARTGHAKTSVLVGLLLNWLEAAEQVSSDDLVVLYSLEEPELRIYHRLLSALTLESGYGLTVNEVRDRLQGITSTPSAFGENSTPALEHSRARLRSWEHRLLVVSRPAWTVEDLVIHAQGLARERPVGGILVDYLQRVPPPRRTFDRRDIEVSAIARTLKTLAVDLATPVVAGAQINREAVANAPRVPGGKPYDDPEVQKAIRARRPRLHHLREGGSEQEADLVLGLLNYRADFEEDFEGQPRANAGSVPEVTRLDIGVLKNRYGAPGLWANLCFHGRYGFIYTPKD